MPAVARAWQAGRTALIVAAYEGKAACVEVLLAAGADKEAKTNVRRARLADAGRVHWAVLAEATAPASLAARRLAGGWEWAAAGRAGCAAGLARATGG